MPIDHSGIIPGFDDPIGLSAFNSRDGEPVRRRGVCAAPPHTGPACHVTYNTDLIDPREIITGRNFPCDIGGGIPGGYDMTMSRPER